MLLALVLLFTILPIVEITLLIELGKAIGIGWTLLIALGTGVLGASLAKQQGLATLARISAQLRAREAPTDALVDGAMILFAGAVLITPGILTDAFGFALLLPPVRAVLKPLLRAAFRRAVKRQGTGATVHVWSTGSMPRDMKDHDIIEGEVIDVQTHDAECNEPRPSGSNRT
ncbi:MAG: FxsA family protein [Planctomycetota bacterium]